MSVKTVQRRVEDDRSPEDRLNANCAVAHVLVPELELATIVIRPVFIQVDEQVQSTFEAQPLVDIEIRMDAKMTTTLGLMQAAAVEVRIRDESLDAGQLLEETKEGLAVQLGEKITDQT